MVFHRSKDTASANKTASADTDEDAFRLVLLCSVLERKGYKKTVPTVGVLAFSGQSAIFSLILRVWVFLWNREIRISRGSNFTFLKHHSSNKDARALHFYALFANS